MLEGRGKCGGVRGAGGGGVFQDAKDTGNLRQQ